MATTTLSAPIDKQSDNCSPLITSSSCFSQVDIISPQDDNSLIDTNQATKSQLGETAKSELLFRVSKVVANWLAGRKESKLDTLEAMINDNALKLLQQKDLAFKQNSYPQLDQLCTSTKFTRKELKWLYLGWKVACTEDCGSNTDSYGSESFGSLSLSSAYYGIMNEQQFQHIYAQFFPYGGDCTYYAKYVFQAMFGDTLVKNGGFITFSDYSHALSDLIKGDIQSKIDFVFKLYDLNNDNVLTLDELSRIVFSIYRLLGDYVDVKHDQAIYDSQAEKLFKKIDVDNTGVITKSQFQAYCLKDKTIIDTIKAIEVSICKS